MSIRTLSTLLLVITVASSLAAIGCHGKGNSTEGNKHAAAGEPTTFTALLQQHTDGLMKHDYASLDKLWADDFTFIDPRGRLLTKQQRLDNLKSGKTAFKSIDSSEVLTRMVSNDAAVTTSRVMIAGQYSGQEGSGDYRAMFVWGKRDGKWKLVALEMTRVEK